MTAELERLTAEHRGEQGEQTKLNFKDYCMDTALGCKNYDATPWIEWVREKVDNVSAVDEDALRRVTSLMVDLQRVKIGGRTHMTPLHVAAHYGNLDMARALAEQCDRAQLNARDKDLKTPLITAAAAGHESLVKFFIEVDIPCSFCVMCYRGYFCGLAARDKVGHFILILT